VGTTLERLRAGGPRLTAGMLTADLLHLGDELAVLVAAGVELVHVDVMDGVFCPQLTLGPPVVAAMRTPLLKDVHLMVQDPLAKLDTFVAAGADLITFQVEGVAQPLRVLQALAGSTNANDPARGIVAGVAVSPSTPLENLEPLLEALDYILVLAINPGWSGQAFLPATAHRIARCRRLIEGSGSTILLGDDGGVNRENAARVAGLGVDIVVSGSAIFDGKAAAANARLMLERIATGARAVAIP